MILYRLVVRKTLATSFQVEQSASFFVTVSKAIVHQHVNRLYAVSRMLKKQYILDNFVSSINTGGLLPLQLSSNLAPQV